MSNEWRVQYDRPEWQKRRLEIMERDGWSCQECGSETKKLNTHHRYYINGLKVWEHPDRALVTLCEPCHERITKLLRTAKQAFGELSEQRLEMAIELCKVLSMTSDEQVRGSLLYLDSFRWVDLPDGLVFTSHFRRIVDQEVA